MAEFPESSAHTAKRIFERLRDEYGFDGQHTKVVEDGYTVRGISFGKVRKKWVSTAIV